MPYRVLWHDDIDFRSMCSVSELETRMPTSPWLGARKRPLAKTKATRCVRLYAAPQPR